MIKTSLLAGISTILIGACTTVAPVESPIPDSDFKVSEISCWDLVTLEPSDASYAYTLIYGYVAGQNGQALQKSEVVERVTIAAIEDCEENPNKSALAAFQDHWEVG